MTFTAAINHVIKGGKARRNDWPRPAHIFFGSVDQKIKAQDEHGTVGDYSIFLTDPLATWEKTK